MREEKKSKDAPQIHSELQVSPNRSLQKFKKPKGKTDTSSLLRESTMIKRT